MRYIIPRLLWKARIDYIKFGSGEVWLQQIPKRIFLSETRTPRSFENSWVRPHNAWKYFCGHQHSLKSKIAHQSACVQLYAGLFANSLWKLVCTFISSTCFKTWVLFSQNVWSPAVGLKSTRNTQISVFWNPGVWLFSALDPPPP